MSAEHSLKGLTQDEIGKLEQQAAELFQESKKLVGFDNVFGCPWLRYWSEIKTKSTLVKGVLLMQDWGVAVPDKQTSISLATAEIADGTKSDDYTIRNLMSSGWRDPIKAGEWIVTNAVWALRIGGDKCDPLPAKIHKDAYQIWSRLLEILIGQNNKLNLVVCGSWSGWRYDFPGKGRIPIKDFLVKWNTWTGKNNHDCSAEGYAYYFPHPCTWGIKPLRGIKALEAIDLAENRSRTSSYNKCC